MNLLRMRMSTLGNALTARTLVRGAGAIALLTLLGVALTGAAQARQPAKVAGTLWMGNENLQGFAELGFDFKGEGAVKMIDADTLKTGKHVNGTWTQDGSNVTIRFSNCEYHGQINGSELSGTANWLNKAGQWTFKVIYVR